MKLFFRIVVLYVIVSFAITAFMRDLTVELIVQAGIATSQFASVILSASTRMLPVFAIVPFIIELFQPALRRSGPQPPLKPTSIARSQQAGQPRRPFARGSVIAAMSEARRPFGVFGSSFRDALLANTCARRTSPIA